MRHALGLVARYVAIVVLAFAVTVIIDVLVGLSRVWDMAIALVIVGLILFHVRWLLGLKRT